MGGYLSSLQLGYGDRPTEAVSIWTGEKRVSDVPLILCHGFLADSTQWYDRDSQSILVARQCGFSDVAGFGADLGGLSTWGNDDLINAIDDLIGFAAANFGTSEDRVALYGTSMGGCSLNWAWRNPEKVVACAYTIPVVSLQGIHDRDPLGIGEFVELAYGDTEDYLDALPEHDPSYPIPVSILSGIADRIHIWYSADDNVIAASEVETFSALTGVEITNVGNVGHSVAFDQQIVADWLIPRIWWG